MLWRERYKVETDINTPTIASVIQILDSGRVERGGDDNPLMSKLRKRAV